MNEPSTNITEEVLETPSPPPLDQSASPTPDRAVSMPAPSNLDQCIADRRSALVQALAAIPSADDLPITTTRKQADQIALQRRDVERRLQQLIAAVERYRAVPDSTADEHWRDRLLAWRQVLVEERLAILSPIKDRVLQGKARNLGMSIACLDRNGREAFEDSGWVLESSRLGELMQASGIPLVGGDPSRNFIGVIDWRGSLKETERRLKEVEKQRQVALADLRECLLDDAARVQQETAQAMLRSVLNLMRIVVASDGSSLVVLDTHGDVIDPATLPADQQQAFAAANDRYRAEQQARISEHTSR